MTPLGWMLLGLLLGFVLTVVGFILVLRHMPRKRYGR